MLRNRGQVSDVACVPALRQRSCSRARRLSWRLPAGGRGRHQGPRRADGGGRGPAPPPPPPPPPGPPPPLPPTPPAAARTSGDLVAVAAAHAHGYPLREIARHLDTHASTLSRRLRRHRSGSAAATNGTCPLSQRLDRCL